MKHSLEYCSLHYLDMWLKHDRVYHESIYYKVARNLPKEYDVDIGYKRYEPILKILEKNNATDFSHNTAQIIDNVQKKISKAFGNRNVLSFTTKLLWLKIRNPIIIYDSQARIALNTPDGDLHTFYEA